MLLAATGTVLVAVAALYVAVPDAARDAQAMPQKPIAVLPFVNFSSSPDTEYFADGLAEELVNGLALLPDLKVAGRKLCFRFKGLNEEIREIGRKLGVARSRSILYPAPHSSYSAPRSIVTESSARRGDSTKASSSFTLISRMRGSLSGRR